MSKFRFVIGILGTLFFGGVTLAYWNELGGYALLLVAIVVFFIWYTIWHWKNM